MNRFSDDIIIIGGGIAGLCAALALDGAGRRVTLVERDDRVFNRASLRNEGKIHLGLIYAAEKGRATADLQLRGALHFQRLLASWTGGRSLGLTVSAPFTYLVERQSILSPDQIAAHFDHVETRYRAHIADDPTLGYLGTRPDRLWSVMEPAALRRWFDPGRFLGGFETAELAIDPVELGDALIAAVAARPGITLRCGHHVRSVHRGPAGFVLEGSAPTGTWRAEAGQVVNAAWDDLYRLDLEAGLTPPPGWLMRLKYRVLARLPDSLRAAPSATLMLGPFGDVVVRGDGTAYLSWYPVGLQGWSHDVACPPAWDAPAAGREDPERAAAIAAEILRQIDLWMPGIGQSTPYQIDAGAILAHGKSDVDDPESGLHGRMDSGVTSHDGWHSFNPGKLTTAPLFAQDALRAVCSGASA
ncbi:MAG TPA: FAD-dependent oxidoreductase [Paracoccaceae bacterium]|nr:FAD-dependent oxidoreductase [Paracoccaceae bacterium]